MWWGFICFSMLHMTTSRWRILPAQHLHWTKGCLHQCLLLHWPIRPCSLPSLPACLSVSSLSHNFCTVLAWIYPQASVVNVPSHMMLISGLVCFCGKPPQPGNSLTFLSCRSPHQAKLVLINSSWLLSSPCLLHWFTSLLLFFFCSCGFQVAAPPRYTHLHKHLSINLGGVSPSRSLFHVISFCLWFISCLFGLPLAYLPSL